MTKASDNEFPSVLFDEQVSAPTTPASGKWRSYFKSDGQYNVDDAGNETGPLGEATSGSIGTFTPTWLASSAPSIGDGTLSGFYQKVADKLYWFTIILVPGASTTYGSGNWTFGNLPFTIKSTSPAEQVVAATCIDTGTASFPAVCRMTAGGTVTGVIVSSDATGARHVNSTTPHTWASTDKLIIEGIVATD